MPLELFVEHVLLALILL